MGFENYTLRMLTEDRDAAVVRRDREQKLINELNGHIEQREAQERREAEQKTPLETSTAA